MYDLRNGKSCISLFIAFAGFLMQRVVASPELPSRRAGGGFGHTVRVVLFLTRIVT